MVGGIGFDSTGRDLFVASPWADAVIRIPLVNPDNKKVIPMVAITTAKGPGGGEPPSPPDGRKEEGKKADPAKPHEPAFYPYTCLVEPGGKRAFVSLWRGPGSRSSIWRRTPSLRPGRPQSIPRRWCSHPKGDALYVACANSTRVSVLDPASGKGLQTIHCALYPNAPNGNTPNSLALTPDGEILFVANADSNNLAVMNVADRTNAKPMGFIPTGWYPTSVRFNPKDERSTSPMARASVPTPIATGQTHCSHGPAT